MCVAAPPQWKRIGPQGAHTLVAAVDPAVADRVYAATRDEVHVSLDGGLIFSKLASLGIKQTVWRPSPFITDIAVLRASSDGTLPTPGEAHIVVQLYTHDNTPSLYVSRDGGRSWEACQDSATGKPIEGNWKQLAAAPGSSTVAFAVGGYFSGNFRTDDGGSTWRALPVPQGLRGPTRFVPVTGSLLVIADETGLFRTTDGGASWTGISAGLPAPPYSYVAIASDPVKPTMLWLIVGDVGTFRSSDAGATWIQQAVSAGAATSHPDDLYVHGDTLWLSNGSYTYRSRDGGRTWTDLNYAPNQGLGAIVARDAITGRLYFSTASETARNLRYSMDDGDTLFPSQRGLQGIDLKYIAGDRAGRLYSWSESRLLRREPLQDGWSNVTPALHGGCGGYYGPGPIVVAEDDTLFAAGPAGILRSSDGGNHWTSTPATPLDPVNWYCLLAVTPGNHRVLYARTDDYGRGFILLATHVFRSSDGGIVWSRINQPFAITDRLHAVDENRLLALGRPRLVSSRDGGNSWSLAFSAVRDFVASASHPEVIVVADDSGMYRSDDGGGTFARLGSLPDAQVTQVAIDPRLGQVVYAVTDQGRVYRSTDAGTNWSPVEAQLDSLVDVYDIVATAATPSTLVAGTSHGAYALYAASDQRELAEFHHPAFGHYFLSADPDEIWFLREGGLPPWRPTGRWFWGWEPGAPGTDPVCRFWSGQTFAPRSSHFYTPYPDECAGLRQGSDWLFEGQTFGWRLPEGVLGSRACRAGTQPLFRAYNNGISGAPNHRYMTDPAVLDAMIAQGWTMEGEAATRVFACVPPTQ